MEEDEREVELSTISAIFPEIVLDAKDPFSATIELPVHPANPLSVRFPVSFEGPAPPTAPLPTPLSSAISAEGEEQNNNDAAAAAPAHNFEVHQLKYLPSLQLHVTLPEGYPAEKPPRFDLTTSPPWLSLDTIERLQADGERLWEDFGRDQVVFAYIDHLQQAAETGFSVVEEGHVLEVPREHQIALLDYDIKATQTAFEKETFDCGICLDPKKGTVCHKMVDCGHVFCVQCLQDFYNNAITEGDLTSVRCLTPDCAKKRGEAQVAANKKPKTQLSPSELLQIPLDREMVTRYVKLKHKVDLESDRNTIYCPRKWCQGAAKSKKHRKPEGLELADSDDEDSDTSEKGFNAQKDLLSICEDCSFAFCSRCYQGWHGEFKLCVPTKNGELTEEDKASLEYMKMHTTPCPTCTAPSSKTHGCNHMICFKCNTHFCYLCSAWLEPGNPYKHYNIVNAGCYQRLWELEGGDGPQFDVRFANGDDEAEDMADEAWGPQDDFVHAAGQHHDIPEIEEPSDEDTPEPEVDRPPIQREGPLVFRINVPRPPPPAAPMAPGLVDPPRGNARGRGGRHVPFRRDRRNRNINANGNGNGNPAVGGPGGHGQGEEREALQRAWVQRFVQMALVDQEDDVEWDSDDEEDAGAWEIPVR